MGHIEWSSHLGEKKHHCIQPTMEDEISVSYQQRGPANEIKLQNEGIR